MRNCEIIGISGYWETLKCREGYAIRNRENHRNRIYVLNTTAEEDVADILILLSKLNKELHTRSRMG